MDKELISVIVPVYNCEKYLEQSIRSLINQTIFDQIEFIFIDDGSTDGSAEIIEKYKKKYTNIFLLQQENRGVSSARNYGISKAKGKYISFFDADDIALPQLYERLYELISVNEADISIVDYSMVFENGEKKKHRQKVNRIWDDSKLVLKDFFAGNLVCTNPVDKMFNVKVIQKVIFPEGYAIGEDMLYIYKVLKKAKRVVVDSNESLYEYILHSDSAMKQKFSLKHIDAVKLAKIIVEDCIECEELYPYAYANYIHEICKMLGLMYKSKAEKEYRKIANKFLKIVRQYRTSSAVRYMSKKHFIALNIMKISPKLYCYIYKILKIG